MGVFGQYAAGINTLKDDPAMQGGGDYVYFTQEGEYVCEVIAIKALVSKNPNSVGDPFVVFELRICEVLSPTGQPAGTTCSIKLDLPVHPNPERWKLKEKYALRDAKRLVGAILKVDEDYINDVTLDNMTENEGARVAGHRLGVRIEASKATDDKSGSTKTFHNARPYPIDHAGNRIPGMTPQEKQQWIAINGALPAGGFKPAPVAAKAPDLASTSVNPAIEKLLAANLDPRQFGFPEYVPAPVAVAAPTINPQIQALLNGGLDPRQFGFPEYVPSPEAVAATPPKYTDEQIATLGKLVAAQLDPRGYGFPDYQPGDEIAF